MSIATNAELPAIGAAPPAGELLAAADVSRLCGISRRTFFRWAANPTFPARFVFSRKCVRWSATEVRRWLASHRQGGQS